MSDPKPGANEQAIAARRGRAQMIHVLRSRVAVLAVGIFLVAFAGLFIELAGGHEPGLGTTSATAVSQPLARDTSSGSDATLGADDQLTSSGSQSDGQATSATDGGSSSAGAASAVVTRQS